MTARSDFHDATLPGDRHAAADAQSAPHSSRRRDQANGRFVPLLDLLRRTRCAGQTTHMVDRHDKRTPATCAPVAAPAKPAAKPATSASAARPLPSPRDTAAKPKGHGRSRSWFNTLLKPKTGANRRSLQAAPAPPPRPSAPAQAGPSSRTGSRRARVSLSVDFKGKENVAVASSPVLRRPSAHKGSLEPLVLQLSRVLTVVTRQQAARSARRVLCRTSMTSLYRWTLKIGTDSTRSPGAAAFCQRHRARTRANGEQCTTTSKRIRRSWWTQPTRVSAPCGGASWTKRIPQSTSSATCAPRSPSRRHRNAPRSPPIRLLPSRFQDLRFWRILPSPPSP